MKAQETLLVQVKRLGKYLTLTEFCTCTHTYQRFADQIDPFPKNLEETLPALEALCQYIIDPVIDGFGRDRFQLTYGFCSKDLKRWLAKKDPLTGKKHGIATPSLDQHMAHEVNRAGRYYCDCLGAACDFKILDLPSDKLVDWIVAQGLPFDSLYFYGVSRPIHISYGLGCSLCWDSGAKAHAHSESSKKTVTLTQRGLREMTKNLIMNYA